MTGPQERLGLEISVVVATWNRTATLKRTLEHLDRQDLPPDQFEVIVVDDGSPDDTAETVAGMRRQVRYTLRYLHHANRGPGYTQNRGIEGARAPLVLLIADDIWLAPEALRQHLQTHRDHPALEVAVVGKVTQSPELTQSLFMRKWEPIRFGNVKQIVTLPYYLFWACHVSAKRDFLLSVGMFREHRGRAGAASHEDVELGYRLHQRGLRLLYNPRATAHHYHVETLEKAMQRAYERGLNFDEFRQYVPAPEVVVRYHLIAWRTLADHARVYAGQLRTHLLGFERNPLLLAAAYLLRALLFNRIAVHGLWLPLLRAAERHSWLARAVRNNMYRGTINYFFFKGWRDSQRLYPATARSVTALR